MNQNNTTRPITPPEPEQINKDLIEQARPGQGIPSQDPSSPAQFPLDRTEAEREANSVLTGGGMVAGAATGAAIGAVAAGPVGIFVGGTVGAVVGALGGAAAGTAVDTETPAKADSARAQSGDRFDSSRQAEPVAIPTTKVPQVQGVSVENLDSLGKDFRAFYPRGHMVVAFQTRTHLEQCIEGLKELNPPISNHLEVTSQQMIEFAERNVNEALFIATLGTSVTTLQGFLEAAKGGAMFLVVPTPDEETAERALSVLRAVPHLIAERYRDLAIETVV